MIYTAIENILVYAIKHLHLNPKDAIFFRNILYDVLNLDGTDTTYNPTIDPSDFNIPDLLLKPILDYAEKNINIPREHLSAKIMGLLSLKPSEIEHYFFSFKSKDDACKWFYNYCIKNQYIQLSAINQNIIWESNTTKHPLIITINLTKPEINNKDVAKLLSTNKVSYPVSVLAKENVGYKGSPTKAARQNIRTIPVKLNQEDWFWQFSPYGYYDEHIIIINNDFTPMVVNNQTVKKLFDFVDEYPHYFIGSNASLPIIGGSILNHEHYQGGRKIMPMHRAKPKINFTHPLFLDIEISILDWYNSAIRLTGKCRRHIEELYELILSHWKTYSNMDINILSHTGLVEHNSASVIARKLNENYCLEMILRNNRTDETYPDGVFHVHPDRQNIKSEAIGLIEAMGLFILPVRLKRQLKVIEDILISRNYDKTRLSSDMDVHNRLIKILLEKTKNIKLTPNSVNSYIQEELNETCASILIDTAVFKPDGFGLKHFINFLNKIEITERI